MDKHLISKYSDETLRKNIIRLTNVERETTAEIVLHLVEFERRALHLALGYSSLFDYARTALGYSEPAAIRRITTARLVGEYPEVYEMLVKKELTLTTASLLRSVITADNAKEVFSKCAGASRREVEGIIAQLKPTEQKKERIREIAVVKKPINNGPLFQAGIPTSDVVTEQAPVNPDKNSNNLLQRRCENTQTAERRFEVSFSVDEECMAKLEEARAVRSKPQSLEALFESMLELYLDKHSPKRRQARRELRREKAKAREGSSEAEAEVESSVSLPKPISRHVPAAVYDEVYIRDGGKCTFVGLDGKRCGSRVQLEMDHLPAFALGGSSVPGELRLLCRVHNLHSAEQVFGKSQMNRFTGRASRQSSYL